ncbi:MAG: primosomal protein N', partial [Chloroflexi bacterium]|nr:primosomal protein N' [Chloroflexota bacterium]
MNYAEIAVDAPVAPARTFSYSIPDSFPVEPGQLVWVPFGRRVIQGIVVSLADTPQVESTRDILQPVEPSPLVTSVGLELALWISRYYLCSLFDSLALLLPPSFKAHVRSRIEPASWTEESLANLKPQTVEALNSLASRGRLNESEFTKSLGANGAREVNRLVGQGIVQRQVDLPRPGGFRYDCWLIPLPAKVANGPEIKLRSSRQAQLIKEINSSRQPYRLSLANKEFGVGTANALVEKGLVGLEWVRTESASPSSMSAQNARDAFTLTMPQANALQPISQAIGDPNRQPRSFLLHGVTGSGKTEVYLRAMEQVVAQDQQAIFLVPEISLTPQTVERVSARFPGRVAVLHSHQKPREKFDQWWNIRDGGCDVVVGPRSALFAPVANLGLIVIDEEHEWTYKQEEGQPLYHARTTALELARLTGAVVILGSATPDVETYYHAQRGRHCLLELPHRINPDGAESLELARTEICDMREELRAGNRSIFSRALAQGLIDCIQQGQQAILFLNRRGSSPIVQCRDCGYVVTCPRCSVSLTYHSGDNSGDNSGDKPGNHSTDARLLCHRCNRRSRVPRSCRQCGGHRIRQIGIGTQRVVEEVSQLLPGVR